MQSTRISQDATTKPMRKTMGFIGARQMLPSIGDLDHYCVFLDFDGTLV